MYDQKYIDERPTYDVGSVAKMRTKERLAIKHFKGKNGCTVCSCLMRTVSTTTKAIECSNCLKQFKGLELPFRQVTKSTMFERGLNNIKLSPSTCGGVNARQAKAWRFTAYKKRGSLRTQPLPVTFSGMNTI